MIHELCKLKTKLTFDTVIICKMNRYDYETTIRKEDIITKVNDHILKIVRPSGEICLLNVDYIVICFITDDKRMRW